MADLSALLEAGDRSFDAKDDKSAAVVECRKKSLEWLRDNYWQEWIDAFQNYKCEDNPFPDPKGKSVRRTDLPYHGTKQRADDDQTSIGMPDTWGIVRRFVARVTSQAPAHRFIADDLGKADRISRALMYQWDRGGVQRMRKKHVTQAHIFGWSVLAWYWEVDERVRKRRVNPLDQQFQKEIYEEYGDKIQQYLGEEGFYDINEAKLNDPGVEQRIAARLIEDTGRGTLIPIEYLYKCYEGPKANLVLLADCFPEPHFEDLNSSRWFCVDRRRNFHWVTKMLTAYGEKYPQLREGFEKLITGHPRGSSRYGNVDSEVTDLRRQLDAAIGRSVSGESDEDLEYSVVPEWTFTERHIPGPRPRLEYVAENGIWIGAIEYPYDLEGKIAFTELRFIDDIYSGIGDSVPRVIRSLNKLHNRQTSKREDLVYNVCRPMYGTSDLNLFENPDQVKREKGFRLFHSAQGPGAIWPLNDGPANAAVVASLNDEGALMRAIQTASGDSNLSMQANVDPQQARTATGSRILAYTGDILTKADVDMLTLALRDELEMMRLLNRSEATEPIKFDANQYRRSFQQGYSPEVPRDEGKMMATPEDFQEDGDVEVEIGSTLADDDDTKLTRSQMIFQMAMSAPALFNVEMARNDLLIAMGKGKDLAKWMPPPPPPPPPPEFRGSTTFSFKGEAMPAEVQTAILEKAGIIQPVQPPQPQGEPPMAPGGPGPGPGPGGLPPLQMPPAEEAGGMLQAALGGQSPMRDL